MAATLPRATPARADGPRVPPAPRTLQRLARSRAGRRAADVLRRSGEPLLWLLLGLAILAPCACFLVLAVSPRLFDEGRHWFTLHYLAGAFSGTALTAIVNSIWVSAAAAGIGIAAGFPMAWLLHRCKLRGRRAFAGGMWLVLLLPSWLPAEGWQQLVQPDSVMFRAHLGAPWETSLVMGPFGVVLLLGLRSVPFSYLAVSSALGGLGQEFEDAARTHGASRLQAIRLVAPILAPAIWSAVAICFAESISDFGVAATLAYASHFQLATYYLYSAIGNFPPSFPAAAATGWLLVGSVAIPLALQARALRGRSYAVLSGRSRQVPERELTARGKLGAYAFVGAFYLFALGVPAFGAVTWSLLGGFGSSLDVTFSNYATVFQNAANLGPLERSLTYGAIVASVTVIGGFVLSRLLTRRRSASTTTLDFMLLAAVALPSVVFAAGYIFAYNLPALSAIGLNLYQTVLLLLIGYTASSLPTNARVLVGAVSQLQASLHDAARAHGAGSIAAWARGVLPAVSRPIVMAWLLTFTGIFLELPISQLLYAPNSPPASVAIEDNLATYHFQVGMAQAVIASLVAFLSVGIVLGGYRLLAPAGWRRIGGAHRG